MSVIALPTDNNAVIFSNDFAFTKSFAILI
jgi:hypothetical protein